MIKRGLKKIGHEIQTLTKLVHYRLTYKLEKDIVTRFHRFYYDSPYFGGGSRYAFWLGIRTFKCPLDLWIYQELIFEKKPDLIIECGTARGGSALFLAMVCDGINQGEILTIDINANENWPKHSRIKYLSGSSTSETIVKQVEAAVAGKKEVMVILDSDHSKDHVLQELRLYHRFVTPGNYLIAEDTNLNGHPVRPDFGPGPGEAVTEFMRENKDFIVDTTREKFYLTFNPGGFLKKVS